MSAALVLADYEGHAISFNDEGWFNATQAAAKFGKEPAQWARLPATIQYLQALERKYGKNTYLKSRRGVAGGTWLHPKLAVRFSQWLDVDFAVWCDEQIDNLLRGKIDKVKLRHAAAASYKVMSEVLLLTRAEDGKTSAPHHFMNEALLVNVALNGVRSGMDRDALTAVDLALLASLEERNAVLIARGVAYASRKVLVEQHAVDWRANHVPRLSIAAANDA